MSLAKIVTPESVLKIKNKYTKVLIIEINKGECGCNLVVSDIVNRAKKSNVQIVIAAHKGVLDSNQVKSLVSSANADAVTLSSPVNALRFYFVVNGEIMWKTIGNIPEKVRFEAKESL